MVCKPDEIRSRFGRFSFDKFNAPSHSRRSWRMLPCAWTRAVIFKAASCAGVRCGRTSGARVSAVSRVQSRRRPGSLKITASCPLRRRLRRHAGYGADPRIRSVQPSRRLAGIRHARLLWRVTKKVSESKRKKSMGSQWKNQGRQQPLAESAASCCARYCSLRCAPP